MTCVMTIGEKYINQAGFEDVMQITTPDAPTFPNDPSLEARSNSWYIDWHVWKDMSEELGFSEWLNRIGLDNQRSNEVIDLTEEDFRVINEAYLLRSTFAEGKAGWDYTPDDLDDSEESTLGILPSGKFDEYLARLIWLRFWIRWALDNCERPSIVVAW